MRSGVRHSLERFEIAILPNWALEGRRSVARTVSWEVGTLIKADQYALLSLALVMAGSWDDVFKVAVGLYVVGTIVWNTLATGERVFD